MRQKRGAIRSTTSSSPRAQSTTSSIAAMVTFSMAAQITTLIPAVVLGGDAHDTWQSDGPAENFWPAWLGEDIPDLDVWTLSYDASPTVWVGHSMELPDRAGNILALLEAERLETTSLIFVCHSLVRINRLRLCRRDGQCD